MSRHHAVPPLRLTGELWLHGDHIVILGRPGELPLPEEWHSCDAAGCGSRLHVLARLPVAACGVPRLSSCSGEAIAYLAQLEAVGDVLGQERLDAADGLHYVAVQSLIAEVEARRLRMGRDPKDQRNAFGDLPEAQEHYSPPSAGDGEPPWPEVVGLRGEDGAAYVLPLMGWQELEQLVDGAHGEPALDPEEIARRLADELGPALPEVVVHLMARMPRLPEAVTAGDPDHHRETLRQLVTTHTDGRVYLCTDLHCEEVLREREPWLGLADEEVAP